jgi:hypothetical protein
MYIIYSSLVGQLTNGKLKEMEGSGLGLTAILSRHLLEETVENHENSK